MSIPFFTHSDNNNILSYTSLNDLPLNPNSENSPEYHLGIDPYVKGLVEFLKGTITPMTIALQGEWGSGKTSLMYKLQEELCGGNNPTYEAVWINTWEYSLLSSSSQALLKIVAKMVTATETSNFNISKARHIILNMTRGVAKTALGQVSNDTSAIDAITDIFTSGGESTIRQLQDELKKNIENRFAKSNKRGIIFFIDDLDRLNPAIAVELLELLQNIFTLNRCVFVLAIDYDVVVKGLKAKFGELTDSNEREFRSFFDKIIQVPFAMPVSNYNPCSYVLDLLKSVGYITQQDCDDEPFKKELLSAIQKTVGNNPRSIKRLTNILSLISCISRKTAKTNDNTEFSLEKRFGKIINFIALAIQVQYPKIFRMLILENDFTSWDAHTLKKMNVEGLKDEKIQELSAYEESDETWEQTLYAVCETDPYLKCRFLDISNLLNELRNKIENKLNENNSNSDDQISLEDIMRNSIQITSITNISPNDSNPIIVSDEEWKRMVDEFHTLTIDVIQKSRNGWSIKRTRNNGKSGKFKIEIQAKHSVEMRFKRTTSDNLPAMLFEIKSFGYFYDNPTIVEEDGNIEEYKDRINDRINMLHKQKDWIEWTPIYVDRTECAKDSDRVEIKDIKVVFKINNIQRFVDEDNIKIVAEIISELAEFCVKAQKRKEISGYSGSSY